MDAHKLSYKFLGLCWLLLALPGLAQAQTPATLTPLIPVEGTLEAEAAQSWQFNAGEGQMISLLVEGLSDSLDPVLTIENSTGQELIRNDDAAYPTSKDAILEGITIPRRDVYTVTLRGFAGTAGAYRLTLLPGYGDLAIVDAFGVTGDWQPLAGALQLMLGSGQMQLDVEGVNEIGLAVNPGYRPTGDFYVQAQVTEITGRNGWQVGLVFNVQDATNYYLLMLNHQGFWRIVHNTAEGTRLIRDWSTHPAIRPGETAFMLGLLVRDAVFDVFYNDQYVGQAVDAEADTAAAQAGQIGMMVGAANAIGSTTSARIAEFVVTKPLQIDGNPLIPSQLLLGNAMATIQELERRRLVPPAGELILTVPESTVTSVRPGVTRILLARGQTYENFAFGTEVSWQIIGDGESGCGLIFRNVDDNNYSVAYLDQTGGYGLSQRQADRFLPGIFGDTELGTGRYHLLVIAADDLLRFYVNGRYAGTAQYAPVAGEVGIAVVNFDPLEVNCQFNDMWLWRWN